VFYIISIINLFSISIVLLFMFFPTSVVIRAQRSQVIACCVLYSQVIFALLCAVEKPW
jgi:hypothetical protein